MFHGLFERANDLGPLANRIQNLPNAIKTLREIDADEARIGQETQELQH